jgi:hypothetical protein
MEKAREIRHQFSGQDRAKGKGTRKLVPFGRIGGCF